MLDRLYEQETQKGMLQTLRWKDEHQTYEQVMAQQRNHLAMIMNHWLNGTAERAQDRRVKVKLEFNWKRLHFLYDYMWSGLTESEMQAAYQQERREERQRSSIVAVKYLAGDFTYEDGSFYSGVLRSEADSLKSLVDLAILRDRRLCRRYYVHHGSKHNYYGIRKQLGNEVIKHGLVALIERAQNN